MKKIISQALAPNSLLHGLLTAVIIAFVGAVKPIIINMSLPTEAQLLFAGKMALTAGIGYILKNGLFGSSQVNNN